jgi:hypothetical protein
MEGAYEVAAETEVLGVRDQLEADVAVVVDMATHGRLIEHGWLNGLGSKLFLGDLWGRKGDEAARVSREPGISRQAHSFSRPLGLY